MPWSCEAKKDAISCEKPGRGAHIRMNPGHPNGVTRTERSVHPAPE